MAETQVYFLPSYQATKILKIPEVPLLNRILAPGPLPSGRKTTTKEHNIVPTKKLHWLIIKNKAKAISAKLLDKRETVKTVIRPSH